MTETNDLNGKTGGGFADATGYAAHANPLETFYDEDDDDGLCYDPEEDCPRCHGAGKCALLSGIEWDYTGPDYDTCPRCGGSGRL